MARPASDALVSQDGRLGLFSPITTSSRAIRVRNRGAGSASCGPTSTQYIELRNPILAPSTTYSPPAPLVVTLLELKIAPIMPDNQAMQPESNMDQSASQRRSGVDRAVDNELIGIVYAQLRAIAQHHMCHERIGHTLQATALVHEAYARLADAGIKWSGPAGFYHAAAEAMRRVLIDHARAKASDKRGAGRRVLELNDVLDLAAADDPVQVMSLDHALSRLEIEDARAAEVVRLRFFAGLTVDQTATALGQSRRTVLRDWEFARAWLVEALENEQEP